MKDQFTLFNKISENTKLVEFCNKVIGYNNILMFDESRNIFLESLKPEYIHNINDIKEVLDIIFFIQTNMKLMILEDITYQYLWDKFILITEEIEKKFPEEIKQLSCKGN